MRPWMLAALGGVGGAGLILTLALLNKKPDLERRGEALRRGVQAQWGPSVYTQQMARLRTELGDYAETVANRAADEHLGTYGLTPARMRSFEALARRLGA